MKLIKIDSINQTCSACPSQWDAKTDTGEDVYIRVRHGNFTLDVNGSNVLRGHPEGVDGCMSTSEMISYVNDNFEKVKFI